MPHQPTTVDTLIHARWVVPVVPSNTVWEHHSIAIHNGEIVAILPTHQALLQYQSEHELELPQHVVCPGLVNAHGHAAMTLLRGLADDKPLQRWLHEDIWPAEAEWVRDDFVRDGTRLAMAEMLLSGTTCFSDMYFFPETVIAEAADLGMRVQTAFPILDFPTAWGSGPDDYLQKGTALLDQYRNSSLVNVVFGLHSVYAVSEDIMRRSLAMANEVDGGIQIHLHETAQEISDCDARYGCRPLALLERLGMLSPRLQAVHMVHANNNDIAMLAEYGSHVIHCPLSNLKLASGFCPSHALLQAGVNVALGSDGAASSNSLDLFATLHNAALLGKAVANDATALPAEQALAMATLHGARALGLEHRIGSLEVGKSADIIAVSMDDSAMQPVHNAISQLVYTGCGQRVQYSWVAGRQLVAAGQLKGLSTGQLIHHAQQWQQRISSHRSTK